MVGEYRSRREPALDPLFAGSTRRPLSTLNGRSPRSAATTADAPLRSSSSHRHLDMGDRFQGTDDVARRRRAGAALPETRSFSNHRPQSSKSTMIAVPFKKHPASD
jgi:hypothetical protein